MKLTPQNSRVREVKYTDCGTNAVLSGSMNNGSILVKPNAGRGNKEKEERGSCWAAGLVGTDIIV